MYFFVLLMSLPLLLVIAELLIPAKTADKLIRKIVR
jgi:hypothetical protein